MAVRADELALCELSVELPGLPVTREVADVFELLRAGKMIPLHCDRMESPALVQEAFVRAVGRLDSFRGDGPLDAWVWRIVVNVASNGRRLPLTVALSENESRNDGSPISDLRTQLASALSQLSERQRLVVFLHYYADLDYATIADALQISSGTVGATLTTARATLGHALEVKEATR